MQSLASFPRRGDGHLWMIALGLSLLLNLALVATVGLAALKSAEFRKKSTPAPPSPSEAVATIYAVPAETAPVPEKRFARTTEDQAAPPEEPPAFIGERDTRAASDRAPVASAPPLPSQAGIESRDELEIETTESDYQDGGLSGKSPAVPVFETHPSLLVPPAPPLESATEPTAAPGPDAVRSLPSPRETLLEGPNPVEVQVPRETGADSQIKPTPEQRSADLPPAPKVPELEIPAHAVRPNPSSGPAFRGFQRKTAVMGSISRNGRSALDVENTALGRYQAVISRAVEQEWQRNCVRHRDFITPGFLTVRFFVETSGKVRSVLFVEDMGEKGGQIQKGFTLKSIRNAEIPAMPRDLRKEYDEEPLELIFRFYF